MARRDALTPQLLTVLREGYGGAGLRADALSGLTVAIVALPISMAIAIGSGLSPDKGLFTAIVGGFLISALGGSRYQIGGPASAFIVLIASIVERNGYDGLLLATAMAGIFMMLAGYLRLGTYIKFVPFPVTVGFTAGIAVIILASQIKDLLGLDIKAEPAALLPKIGAIWTHLGTIKPAAVALSLMSIGLIVGLRRHRPKWPGMLIAVVVSAFATALLQLDVPTIGSRFGGIPNTLPWPSLPAVSLAKLRSALPDAVAIALLGAIESLLSAVVADGMSGRKHRSNMELVAQGAANIACALFSASCATGTIARTATNVRSGAKGPVSGMLHAVYLLAFMAVAAPLAKYIPLACLGGVLAVVAWGMAEKAEFAALLRNSWGDAAVLLATFFLTIFDDLTTAIGVGVTMGAFLLLHRMAGNVEVNNGDGVASPETGLPDNRDGEAMVYRVSGTMFFGATAEVSAVLDQIGVHPRIFVLDFADVPLVDTSAAKMLEAFVHKLRKSGTILYFTGASKGVRRTLLMAGLGRPHVRYARTAGDGVRLGRAALAGKNVDGDANAAPQ